MSVTLCPKEMLAGLDYEPPCLMLDSATLDTAGLSAIKYVTVGEPFFQGHFPNFPLLPGVMQIEALFQLGVLGCRELHQTPGLPQLVGVRHLRFRRPVQPAEVLQVTATLTPGDEPDTFVVTGQACVDDEVATEGELTLRFYTDVEALLRPRAAGLPAPLPDADSWSDGAQVMDILPHRQPMLFIDRLLVRETDDLALLGIKNVTANEPNFLAHADGWPFVPGTLLLEALAQLGGMGQLIQPENRGRIALFMSVDRLSMRRPSIPGEQLWFQITELSTRGRFGRGHGNCRVGDETIAEATLKFALKEEDD
jgi:3-hydroxyacyl-[acyl-carrier-protein] dehydratase